METITVEHQLHCPYALLQLERPGLSIGESAEVVVCPDRRCSLWFDLKCWFGLDSPDLPIDEFRLAFTDIAHGGSGLYEKLVVLGHKALETFSEMYIYEQFDASGIPHDLLEGREIPEEITRLSWTRKRVERLTSPNSLCAFAKGYLATAQTLPTDTSAVKYIKACIGYSVQLPSLEARRLFEWLPTLTEHIYWAQRLKLTELHDEDNELLQDIQEYFGFPYSKLIPRIREVLATNPMLISKQSAPTGNEIIRFYAFDYFRCLSEESAVPLDSRAAWITDETNHFMDSFAFRLFAGCWLNLGPFLATMSYANNLPDSKSFVTMFEGLLASCYVLSSEEKSRTWMSALIHRLRQIQLSIRLRRLDILLGGPTADLNEIHDIDIHRWSSLSHILQNRLINWTLCELDDISVNALNVPSAAIRKAAKSNQLPPSSSPPPQSPINNCVDKIISCISSPREPRISTEPIRLFHPHTSQPIELIPIGPVYGRGNVRHPSTPRSSSTGLNPQRSFWRNLASKSPNGMRGLPKSGSDSFPYRPISRPSNDFNPSNRLPNFPSRSSSPSRPSFLIHPSSPNRPRRVSSALTRNTVPVTYSSVFNVNRRTRAPRGCNFWYGKTYDSDGNELWRPPGALLMRPRKRRTIKSCPPDWRKKTPPRHLTTTSTSDSESDMKLDIHYTVPEGGKPSNRPIEARLYANEQDLKQGKEPALKSIIEMTPEQQLKWQSDGVITGTDLKATIYRDDSDGSESKPLQIEFVSQGPTGSPRVYVSGPEETRTKTGKHTKSKSCRYLAESSTDSSSITRTASTTESSTSTETTHVPVPKGITMRIPSSEIIDIPPSRLIKTQHPIDQLRRPSIPLSKRPSTPLSNRPSILLSGPSIPLSRGPSIPSSRRPSISSSSGTSFPLPNRQPPIKIRFPATMSSDTPQPLPAPSSPKLTTVSKPDIVTQHNQQRGVYYGYPSALNSSEHLCHSPSPPLQLSRHPVLSPSNASYSQLHSDPRNSLTEVSQNIKHPSNVKFKLTRKRPSVSPKKRT